jgi:hypothetical protein
MIFLSRVLTRRFLPVFSLLLLALALSATVAEADHGVGVTVGKIQVDDRLAKGGSYALPSIGVINTGSEQQTYEVVLSFEEGQSTLKPKPAWFDIRPERFDLAPGATRQVALQLVLPTGATPGDYEALIEAHEVATGEGVAIGAAAATRLTFTVKQSSWLDAQATRLNRELDSLQPWTFVIPGAALTLIALRQFSRSFEFSLRRRRR